MKYFSQTDIGHVRKKNEDHHAIIKNKDNDLLVVLCDGVGGSNAGDIASFETVKYFCEVFIESSNLSDRDRICDYLKYHIHAVNKEIFSLSTTSKSLKDMGTTLTGVLITNKYIIGYNLGDSRIYVVDKNNNLVLVSTDHNVKNDLIYNKNYSEEQANSHPKSTYITKAIGYQYDLQADFYEINNNIKSILICSDGLSDHVNTNIISHILMTNDSISLKVGKLINSALDVGGKDNITVVLLERE